MFRAHGLIPAVAALASLLLALVVYGAAPDRRLGRVFGFLALTLVFWNLIFFALYAFPDYDTAFRLSRLFRTGGLFLLPAILHLSLVLPGRPIPAHWKIILIVDYAVSVFMAWLNIVDLLVTQLATFYWGYYSIGTGYYLIFTISLILNFALSVGVLTREYYTTTDPRMRLQLKFWLFGMAVALPPGVTNLLPAYGIRFYPLGNLASVLWAAVVGYAIVRHRLMDIELVVAKGLAYVGVSVIVLGPVTAVFILLQDLAFGEVHYDFTAISIVLFALVGILFPRIQSLVERRLGRSLFRSKFAARAALESLAGEVVRVLDRQRLLGLLCERIAEAFSIDSVSLYLREGAGGYSLKHIVGPAPLTTTVEPDHRLVRLLLHARDALMRDEGPKPEGNVEHPAVRMMMANGWEVIVPFRSGRELVGFASLGPRRGLEAFTAGDMSLLGRVAAEATIALQNARLFEEVRQSRAIISRAGRLSAIGTLAAGIAHEIRNPLVSIQTFFQLAPQRLNDEEFMTSFLKLAEAEVKRIESLVSELLTFAKSPSPAWRSVSVPEIAERATILLEPQARSQGVTLTHRSEGQPPPVVADGDQIMQVVLNIGLNAIQATPRGGAVSLECREVSADGIPYCQLEIRDTGRGIPEALRDAIFDPFFTTKDRGTGLGLAVAHQIVVESGGSIGVKSVEGEGSQFTINLPADVVGDDEHSCRGVVAR